MLSLAQLPYMSTELFECACRCMPEDSAMPEQMIESRKCVELSSKMVRHFSDHLKIAGKACCYCLRWGGAYWRGRLWIASGAARLLL